MSDMQHQGEAEAFVRAAAAAGLPLRVEPMREPKLLAAYEKRHVLVRPDGHVAWRGDTLPQDVTAVVRTVSGNQ